MKIYKKRLALDEPYDHTFSVRQNKIHILGPIGESKYWRRGSGLHEELLRSRIPLPSSSINGTYKKLTLVVS